MTIQDSILEMIRKHHLAVESLTEEQLANAIQQAIHSGEFVRHIYEDAQGITYIPYREKFRLQLQVTQLQSALRAAREALELYGDTKLSIGAGNATRLFRDVRTITMHGGETWDVGFDARIVLVAINAAMNKGDGNE